MNQGQAEKVIESGRTGQPLATEEELRALSAYRSLAAVIQELWRMVYDRTRYREWLDADWPIPGAGSCAVERKYIEKNIDIPLMVVLRDQQNQKTPGQPASVEKQGVKKSACEYHRQDTGCILDTLKDPVCLSYVSEQMLGDIQATMGRTMRRHFANLMRDVYYTLIEVQGKRRAYIDGTIEHKVTDLKQRIEEFEGLLLQFRVIADEESSTRPHKLAR